MSNPKVYKIGNIGDLTDLSIENKSVLQLLRQYATILTTEYGADRNINTDDGGYILYATPDATTEDIKACFDYTCHTVEYVDKLEEVCSAVYLLSNDYGVVIVMMIANAPPEILKEIDV